MSKKIIIYRTIGILILLFLIGKFVLPFFRGVYTILFALVGITLVLLALSAVIYALKCFLEGSGTLGGFIYDFLGIKKPAKKKSDAKRRGYSRIYDDIEYHFQKERERERAELQSDLEQFEYDFKRMEEAYRDCDDDRYDDSDHYDYEIYDDE